MLFNYHVGRFVLGLPCVGGYVRLGLSSIRAVGFSPQHGYYSSPTAPNLQQTAKQEKYDQCANSTA
jgi:hypothetical protein